MWERAAYTDHHLLCDDERMSFFRKQPATAAPMKDEPPPEAAPPPQLPSAVPRASQPALVFDGPSVDFRAIYHASRLPEDELDRVQRAEELLQSLPANTPQTREVVDATFRAFGVDRAKILAAAGRQVEVLEGFVRASHEQTQRVNDANAQRIAELEAEIERCRQASARATSEGEERARSVNAVLLKVQRVLAFFGDDPSAATQDDLDEDTTLSAAEAEKAMKPLRAASGASTSAT
jgi:hypothetical protein